MPNLFKGVVKLTEDQYKTLLQGGSFEVDGQTITYDENTLYVTDYSIDTQLDINSENPVTNKAIATAINNLESSVASNGVTINTDQDISGNKNFTGEVTKNGVDLATIEQVPVVSDSLNAQYRDNALSVNQGIILNDKITTLMENVNGRVQSFSIANLEALGTLFNIDVSEIKDEYVVPSSTITYKEKEYTLKTGDIFLIVDVAVPDYWFSADDMKLFKLETSKVDLTKYVDIETDQTIGGNKTFSNQIAAENGIKVGTGSTGDNDVGVLFGTKAKVGVNDSSGAMGIYANGEIVFRPSFPAHAAGGFQVSNDSLYPSRSEKVILGTKVNKFKDLYLSGNLSDGTNSIAIKDIANKSDLDGLATEEYVRENGGKIDKIKVNGVEQTINDKTVEIVVDVPEQEKITDYYKVGNKLSGVNLNTIVVPGNYGVANDCTNMPIAENGTLFVGEYDKGSYVQQMFLGEKNKVYTRNSTSVDNSTWSEWLMLARSSDFNDYLAKAGGTMTGNIVLSNLKGLVSSDGTNVIYTEGPNGNIYIGSLDKGLGLRSKDTKPFYIDKDNNITRFALMTDIPDLSNYLPKSGGSMTGSIRLATNTAIGSSDGKNLISWFNDAKVVYVGETDKTMYLQGVGARPTYVNSNNESKSLALYEDISGSLGDNYLPLDGSKAMTGKLNAQKGITVGAQASGGSGYNEIGIDFGTYSKISARDGLIGVYANGDIALRPYYGNNTANGVKITETVLHPTRNEVMDLGTSTYKFKNIYASGTANLHSAKISSYLALNNEVRLCSYDTNGNTKDILYYANSNNIGIGNDTAKLVSFSPIQPASYDDNLLDLGTATARWKDLYIYGNLHDGTNYTRVADIKKKYTWECTISGAAGWYRVCALSNGIVNLKMTHYYVGSDETIQFGQNHLSFRLINCSGYNNNQDSLVLLTASFTNSSNQLKKARIVAKGNGNQYFEVYKGNEKTLIYNIETDHSVGTKYTAAPSGDTIPDGYSAYAVKDLDYSGKIIGTISNADVATKDGSGNVITSTYLPLSGGTFNSSAALIFSATKGTTSTSSPTALTYGRLQAYGTLCINANTDNSGTEYLILTAGKGMSSSTSDGLAIGTDTLTWKDQNVATQAYVNEKISDVITITKTLTIGTSWIDTGISGTDLSSGTYIMQVSGFNSGYGGLWGETFSGVMTWYSGDTNSTNSCEILLHNAGHADNSGAIYLRTQRASSNGILKLQIAARQAASTSTTVYFKFRKMI